MLFIFILGIVFFVVAGIFMHFLIIAMRDKYYLRWPREAFAIISLYLLGVLPCVIGLISLLVELFNI